MKEFYLKRKIDADLLSWKKEKDHKPLIVLGARQVGKTCSIRNFAKVFGYESFVEINFATNPKFKRIISDGYSAEAVVSWITRIDSSFRLIPNRTLVFFDEITEFPDICTSLKFFAEDGRYDVICSGSLLGTNYKKIESNSVGYKSEYMLRSLDFEEYIWARTKDKDLVSSVLNKMISLIPFSQAEYDYLNEIFLEYVSLGGMPSPVLSYLKEHDFGKAERIQNEIVIDYKEDIRKYALGLEQGRIMNVFNSVPSQLAKENKKFQLSKIHHGARFKEYQGSIEWIVDSGIVTPCYAVSNLELPLAANVDYSRFKLYLSDTGILLSLLDSQTRSDVRTGKNLGIFKGGLYENIAAEALAKIGYPLYYFKKEDSTLEEEFLVRSGVDIVPIEIKSNDGRAKSLNTLVTSDEYQNIRYGIKFADKNIGHANNIYTFPYFCLFLLEKFLEKRS